MYALSKIDYQLLTLHWTPILGTEDVAILGANGCPLTGKKIKWLLNNAWEKIAQSTNRRGYRVAYLYCEDGNQYPIPAQCHPEPDNLEDSNLEDSNLGANNSSEFCNSVGGDSVGGNDSPLIIPPDLPIQELTLDLMEQSQLPTYINSIRSTQKLYCNVAGANAQGMPPEQFLAINSALDLNDAPEFDRRIHAIATEGQLTEYEYMAWRWFFDLEAGRFRTKRMSFVSNFRKIQYCGQDCWMGQVLQAQETSTMR